MIRFDGERYVPGVPGEIAYEHWHRYAFAHRFVGGRRVLDAACGEGYGTALLAGVAVEVAGLDIDQAAVAHARARYGDHPRVRFAEGSVTALPFADASFDAVVSFETIEHLAADDQPRMLAEFRRVLVPGGILVLSSPNKRIYTDERKSENPFHLRELYREELAQLLDVDFPARHWYHQRPLYASALWSETPSTGANRCEAWSGGPDGVAAADVPDGLYFVVIAARTPASLPEADLRVSLYTDSADSEYTRARRDAAEVMRLDALVKERDAGLVRQATHVAHLEELVAVRERLVRERDAELAAVNAARESVSEALTAASAAQREAQRMLDESRAVVARRDTELARVGRTLTSLEGELRSREAALEAQERLIAYQHGFQWWLRLPWLRMKLGWQRRFAK